MQMDGNGIGTGTGEVRGVQAPLQQGLMKLHSCKSPAHAWVGTTIGVVVAPGVVVPRGVTVMLPVAVGVVEAAVTDGVPLPPGKVKSSSPQPTASTTANAAAAESKARKARRFRLTLPEERSMPAVSDGRARGLLAELLGDAHPIRMGATLLECLAQCAQTQLAPLGLARTALPNLLVARHRSHGTLLERYLIVIGGVGAKGMQNGVRQLFLGKVV